MTDASPEQLTVERFDQGDVVVVALAGELDIATAEIAEKALRPGVDVLDLTALEFMDSAGVRVLLGICVARGEPLVVRGVTRAVRRILNMTGLSDMLIFEDETSDQIGSRQRR